MKITDVTTTLLRYPHGKPVHDGTTPPSRSISHGREQLFVHIKTDAGFEGLGMGEGVPGARQIVETVLKDVLLGQDPFNIEKLWNEMHWSVRGYGRGGVSIAALSAADIALWDLKAKALGMPLYRLLGPFAESVPVYASGGWTNLSQEDLVASMKTLVERGFSRVKMKVGNDFGQAEREDMERVAAVRQALGPSIALYVDANGAYYPKQAIYMAKAFEQLQVGWFEEPVSPENIEGLADVRRETSIPIAGGEQLNTRSEFRDLLVGGGVDIVQPDVKRVGGITEWMRISHLIQAFGPPIAPHAAQLVHLHLACATPNLKSVEYLDIEEEGDKLWYTEFPQPRDGMWSPYPDRPGLGLELSPFAIERWAV